MKIIAQRSSMEKLHYKETTLYIIDHVSFYMQQGVFLCKSMNKIPKNQIILFIIIIVYIKTKYYIYSRIKGSFGMIGSSCSKGSSGCAILDSNESARL